MKFYKFFKAFLNPTSFCYFDQFHLMNKTKKYKLFNKIFPILNSILILNWIQTNFGSNIKQILKEKITK